MAYVKGDGVSNSSGNYKYFTTNDWKTKIQGLEDSYNKLLASVKSNSQTNVPSGANNTRSGNDSTANHYAALLAQVQAAQDAAARRAEELARQKQEAAQAACIQSGRTNTPILDCLLAQAGLSDEGLERVRRLKVGFEALETLPGEALMRTIWGPLGYGGFVTERRLDPGKYFILQMLAAREPSAEAFLARLDTLRQTIRVHTDASDARLTLSTIHSSKGLEYEQVYLLDIHDGVLPSRPDAADGTADERREYEEDRRLFYVAMTRAKDELTLFDYPDAPSAFIREAQGYLPVPVRAKDDFAAIVPENACGLRYRHETHGEGRILAQCEDEMLLAFPDGDRLMRAGQMLLEQSRAEVWQAPGAPAAAQTTPNAQTLGPGSVIRHKKYGMGRIVSIDGPFADIRFEGETAARRFHLAQSLRSGFLFSAG